MIGHAGPSKTDLVNALNDIQADIDSPQMDLSSIQYQFGHFQAISTAINYHIRIKAL